MMMSKRTMNQRVLQATLIGMLALLGGCTDEMAGLMESDKAVTEENAKPMSNGMPPGLANLVDVLGGALPSPFIQDASPSATIEYEMEGYDLESASAYIEELGQDFPPQVDFYFAYNADTDNHIRLFQQYPVWIAYLSEMHYAEMSCDALIDVSFTQDLLDVPMDSNDTIVLYTADGNYYKIGNAQENDNSTVTFSYDLLDCQP